MQKDAKKLECSIFEGSTESPFGTRGGSLLVNKLLDDPSFAVELARYGHFELKEPCYADCLLSCIPFHVPLFVSLGVHSGRKACQRGVYIAMLDCYCACFHFKVDFKALYYRF